MQKKDHMYRKGEFLSGHVVFDDIKLIYVVQRVLVDTIDKDFKMKVRAGGVTGAAYGCDGLALADSLSGTDIKSGAMLI